ncbi:hypothetical protein JMN32_07265 [Fulvivirga sp. 29W222]|uniref:Uncharacterized protein n=1 Tax=Fulvivirga marina TaxID=2494733 RepID=A0A937FXB6_9BACT|nr:hypothetical protein [Fulvivirga marina]MBL6446100.1 hypothetical protein [Fulvivirga marina]
MKNLLMYVIAFGIFFGCSSKAVDKEHKVIKRINYGHNIVILADLSNRVLRQKSLHDTTIIYNIIDKLKPFFEKSVDLNIYDRFAFYSINQYCVDRLIDQNPKFNLDLAEFKNHELELSNYLYRSQKRNYDSDVSKIKATVKKLYGNNARNTILPADVWHYFNEVLDNTIVDTTSFKQGVYLNRRKNKVILITDGYVEAGKYGNDKTMLDKRNPNRTKFLSTSLLNKFRSEFNNSEFAELEKFYTTNKYGLIPVKNPLISEIELLVLEIDDRTIKNGVTSVSPTDAKIIKLFWHEWFEQSGIDPKHFEIHDVVKNEQELDAILTSFLSK